MKSMTVQTRRPVLTRETIGRVVGGWPIWLHRAGLKRLAGRRYVADLPLALSASLGGVSFAPAPRSGARDARSR